MKKLTSIAAALTMATAFCGFCTGCAAEIESDAEKATGVTLGVSQAAEGDHEVILNPGWYYNGSTKVDNTIDDAGAEKMTTDQANGEAGAHNGYFVDNAYFARVSAGENLPSPTTTRTGMTFAGWAYAKDGEVVWVEKMPSALTEDLYLYAEWRAEGSDAPDIPDIPVQGSNYMQVGANKHALTRNTGNTTREEYWLGGAKVNLTVGTKISLYMDGQKVSAFVEPNSSGVTMPESDIEIDEFTVAVAGEFVVYLHKNSSDWSVQFVVSTPVDETTVTIPSNAVCSDITFANGSVKIYIKNGDNFVTSFTGYNMYMWTDNATDIFGAWPGKAMAATMSSTVSLTPETYFIINNGSNQTRDLKGMSVGGTYLVTLAENKNESKVEKIKVA